MPSIEDTQGSASDDLESISNDALVSDLVFGYVIVVVGDPSRNRYTVGIDTWKWFVG